MAQSGCMTTVDSNQRELTAHGSAAWPIACYNDDFSRFDLPWHWHDELELTILMEGRAVFAVGGEKIALGPGEGLFINAGVLHAAWGVTPNCRFRSVVFHHRLVGGSPDSVFHRNYILPLIQNAALEHVVFSPNVPWQARGLEAMGRAWQENVEAAPGYEFRVRNALSELVGLFVEIYTQ